MKPLRRCWRVEDMRGYGPTESRQGFAWQDATNQDDPWRMPTPSRDVRLRGCVHPYGWLFAFPDVTTLAKWVGPTARTSAHRRGFVIRVYGVSWDSHTLYREQISFDRRQAVQLRTLSLLEIPAELEVERQRQMAARISSTTRRSISLVLPDCRGVMRSWSLAA